MGKATLKHKGNFALLSYKDLQVAATIGTSHASLEKLFNGFEELGVEYSIINEGNREFGAFFFKDTPIVDGTLVRYPNGSTSIVNYGLSQERTYESALRLIGWAGLINEKPESRFVKEISDELEIVESISYRLLEKLSFDKNISFNKLFSATRYANFLNRYKGLPMQEAIKQSYALFI